MTMAQVFIAVRSRVLVIVLMVLVVLPVDLFRVVVHRRPVVVMSHRGMIMVMMMLMVRCPVGPDHHSRYADADMYVDVGTGIVRKQCCGQRQP